MMRTIRSRTRRLLVVMATAGLLAAGAGAAGAASTPAPGTSARIIGGTPAPPGAWPAQAVLLDAAEPSAFDAQFCGATLIQARWVLTAAHCVVGAEPSQIQVAVGISRLSRVSAADRLTVSKIVVHPGFAAAGEVAAANDVALVQLARPRPGPYAPLVGPAQDGAWGPGTVATVTGWGTTVADDFVRSDVLRQVRVRVISDDRCAAAYPGIDGPTNVCAGWMLAGGRDACKGDSGGPLWAPVAGAWRQIGIVSAGDGCAEPGHPGTYADVRGLRSWILRTAAAG